MKKSFTLILVFALCAVLCMALVGCSSNGSSAEGKWNVSSILNPDGTETTGEDLAAVMGDTYYDFQSGGKFIAVTAGSEMEGTWKQNGNSVTLEADGQSFTATIDGNTMTMENNGATITFTK